jgi:ABC-2 type transport system permease protein
MALIFIISCALTGLGFAIAWRMESTSGFHAIMNVFLLPMWLLSGAFFPASGAPAWLDWVMWVNPLTYSMAGLRRALYAAGGRLPEDLPSMSLAVGVTLAFLLVTILVSAAEMRRKADR